MTRHFYEVFDPSGKRVCEIIALDVAPEPDINIQPNTYYRIAVPEQEGPLLSLPPGFSLRLMA